MIYEFQIDVGHTLTGSYFTVKRRFKSTKSFNSNDWKTLGFFDSKEEAEKFLNKIVDLPKMYTDGYK